MYKHAADTINYVYTVCVSLELETRLKIMGPTQYHMHHSCSMSHTLCMYMHKYTRTTKCMPGKQKKRLQENIKMPKLMEKSDVSIVIPAHVCTQTFLILKFGTK